MVLGTVHGNAGMSHEGCREFTWVGALGAKTAFLDDVVCLQGVTAVTHIMTLWAVNAGLMLRPTVKAMVDAGLREIVKHSSADQTIETFFHAIPLCHPLFPVSMPPIVLIPHFLS